MELEVLNTVGIPDSGVLSVRAGGTRRQVQLSAMDRPLRFPCTQEDCPAFKVDVLDLLGSARLAYNPDESVYNLALDPPDHKGSDAKMEVSFSVRGASDGPGIDSDAPQSPSKSVDRERDNRKEVAAREYLKKHGLVSFMQFLMQSLMKDKPSDPYAFLQKQVTKKMVSESSRQMVTTVEEQGLENLLAKVSPEGCMVAPEQLKKLEADAAAASERLREDNQKLREMAEQLRIRYTQLLDPIAAPEQALATHPDLPATVPKEPPTLQCYRDIARLQDDITSLAKENSQLVSELSQMRSALDTVSREIVAAGDAVVMPT